MVSIYVNYPILQEKPWLFAACLAVVLVLSFALFALARWHRWAAVGAVIATVAWILLFLPDIQYYLEVRSASPNSIVEPFERRYYVFGYILVLLPVPFVLLGLWMQRKRTI
jgi:hypothetical protein